jgi:hypothetical protein
LTCDGSEPFSFSTEKKAVTGSEAWCIIDLGRVYTVKKIEIENRADGSQGRIVGAEISISVDEKKWQRVGVFKKSESLSKFIFIIKDKPAKFVKIEQTNGEFLHLKTMKVFGKQKI